MYVYIQCSLKASESYLQLFTSPCCESLQALTCEFSQTRVTGRSRPGGRFMSIDICHDVLWMCFEWSSSPRRRILHGMLPMRTRFLDHQLTGAFLARTVWRHSCSPTSPVWNVLRPFFRSALLAPWSKSSFSRMRSEGFPSFECVCVCVTPCF